MRLGHAVSPVLLAVMLSSSAVAQATLTGFVRDDGSLKPMKDVQVSIEAISKRVRTDDKGKFTLRGIPAGTYVVQVHRLGFDPLAVTLELTSGTKEQVFYLKEAVAQLDTVTATAARPRGLGREAFEERRKFGFGKFLDSVELRKWEHRKAVDLFSELGVRAVVPPACTIGSENVGRPPLAPGMGYVARQPPYCDNSRTKKVAVGGTSTYECPMLVVINGVIVYRPTAGSGSVGTSVMASNDIEWERTFDVNALMVSSLESVEIYRRHGEIPLEFVGNSGSCGVLVLWQRR
jgi:hypothetical protein